MSTRTLLPAQTGLHRQVCSWGCTCGRAFRASKMYKKDSMCNLNILLNFLNFTSAGNRNFGNKFKANDYSWNNFTSYTFSGKIHFHNDKRILMQCVHWLAVIISCTTANCWITYTFRSSYHLFYFDLPIILLILISTKCTHHPSLAAGYILGFWYVSFCNTSFEGFKFNYIRVTNRIGCNFDDIYSYRHPHGIDILSQIIIIYDRL